MPATCSMPRRPWRAKDQMDAISYAPPRPRLAPELSVHQQHAACAWRRMLKSALLLSVVPGMMSDGSSSDDSSECSASDSASCSSSSSSRYYSSSSDEDEQGGMTDVVVRLQAGLVGRAQQPWRRPKVRYSRGPERWSFARIERDLAGTRPCFDMFRFELRDLRRLLAGFRFPERVVVQRWDARKGRHRTDLVSSGEEALCVLLRRLSYPRKLTDLLCVKVAVGWGEGRGWWAEVQRTGGEWGVRLG